MQDVSTGWVMLDAAVTYAWGAPGIAAGTSPSGNAASSAAANGISLPPLPTFSFSTAGEHPPQTVGGLNTFLPLKLGLSMVVNAAVAQEMLGATACRHPP